MWDWPWLEYIWYTLLHRSDDFDESTPKYLAEQFKVYRLVNGIDKEKQSDDEQTFKKGSIEDVL